MKNYLKIGLTLGLTMTGGAALAAGAGTGIETGFSDIGTDLQTLLGGAGGFIIIISIALGVLMLAIGRGWGAAVGSFAVAMFLGYGVSALTGIAGVSGFSFNAKRLIQSWGAQAPLSARTRTCS